MAEEAVFPEPRRMVTISLEFSTITADIHGDMKQLEAIRRAVAQLADQLMAEGPGAKAVNTTWSVDRIEGDE